MPATADDLITLLSEHQFSEAILGSYRESPVCAICLSAARWLLVRRGGDEVLSKTGKWVPAGALLSRNVVPAKAMIFSGPAPALDHLRSIAAA